MGKQSQTKQSAVRFGPDLQARLAALRVAMSMPGRDATQSDVLRVVVYAGLPSVEEAHGIAAPVDVAEPAR